MTPASAVADATAVFGLLLRATLLIGAAWAGAAALGKIGASAAARHAAWMLCIVALLALPLLRWLVPALPVPVLPAEAAIPDAATAPPAPAPLAAGAPGATIPAGWAAALLAVYTLGALTLLLRLAAGRWVLARLWRGSGRAGDDSWGSMLADLSRDMRLTRPVELRISPGSVMPMTWGTFAPRMLLPAEACAWPAEQRRLVLLHELAHVARRDSLGRSAASLACALYWFHPGAWFAARRLRMEQEHAADDRVLAAGGSAQAYARSLLDVARHVGTGFRPELAATMAGMLQLERRLLAIAAPARPGPPSPALVGLSAALAGFSAIAAVAVDPVGTALPAPGTGGAGHQAPVSGSGRTGSATPPAPSGSEAEPVPAVEAVRAPAAPAGLPAGGRHGASAMEGPPDDTRPASRVAKQRRARPPDGVGRDEVGARSPGPGEPGPLPDYGWALRQREPNLQTLRLDVGSPSARPALPKRFGRPEERTGRPKWARYLPQVTRSPEARALPASPDQRLMLSFSTDTGAP